MTYEQLTLEDAARQWQIARLSRSLERWRERGTDLAIPDQYARYCDTLAHLEAGGTYIVRDVTEECLRACAKGIHASVMASDRAVRAQRRDRTERRRQRQ